jgi:putative oxidoreductase
MLNSLLQSLALLLLRISLGCLMLGGHGIDKLLHFRERASAFPNPIGLGSFLSLCLAIFAEFFCSILLILGIATRLAVIPLVVTMLVALVLVHGGDPWQKKELAALYLTGFLAILIAGPGPFALDRWLWKWKQKPE